MSTDAYSAASREAYEIVDTVIKGIISEIQHGYLTDENDRMEYFHDSVDSALICTNTHYVCAWALPDSDEFDPNGVQNFDFDQVLAQKAYCNLRSACERRWGEIEEALKVAEDKRLEGEGVES